MAVLVVPAPAKINIFLHVTGRRDDGYHTLETVFALIDLADIVTLSRRDDGAIVRSRELPGVAAAEDLSLRAAHALKRMTGTRFGVNVSVEKRIPLGAGSGGGSSDAASALLALNRLWQLALPRDDLLRLAVSLGADVAFFVGGENALARGVGEALTPMSIPASWIALALPRVAVATGSVFDAAELTRNTASAKMDVFSENFGRNDLAPVVAVKFPVVAEAIAALNRGSRGSRNAARMTGSGACAFAAFPTEQDARRALSFLPQRIPGCVAKTLARHPLAPFAA